MNADEMEAGRELDELVVSAMGWHISSWADETDGGYQLFDADGRYKAKWDAPEGFKHELAPRHRWSPSTDIAAVWKMEEMIEQRGFNLRYTQMLMTVLLFEGFTPEHDEELWWALIHASPIQRCRAALKAIHNER